MLYSSIVLQYHGTRRVRTRVRTIVRTIVRTTLSQKQLEIQALSTMVGMGTWYLHGTRAILVPWYQMVRTRVRTYVLIMLCHNFLIGKGHTCALRTTCVLGGYTAAS
jgi:hypothetical protein